MEVNATDKIQFLKGYRLLYTKISRLKEMIKMFPEKEAKFENEINVYIDGMEYMEKVIEEVDHGILSEILYQKYVLGKTLFDISYELHYSKRQIERLHIASIEKLKIL